MNLSSDLQYFLDQALSFLSSSATPNWARVEDRKQPVFRYWHCITWKLLEGDPARPVSIGDKFEVIVGIAPVVRLYGNILVQFGKKTPVVVREIDGKQSFVTGLTAWSKIHSAKMALEPKERITLEITTTYECTNTFRGNMYKAVGNVTCKNISF